MTLTKPMLRLLLDLHDAPKGTIPAPSVAVGTARALVARGFARWNLGQVTIEPRGRMVVARALAAGMTTFPRRAA